MAALLTALMLFAAQLPDSEAFFVVGAAGPTACVCPFALGSAEQLGRVEAGFAPSDRILIFDSRSKHTASLLLLPLLMYKYVVAAFVVSEYLNVESYRAGVQDVARTS